jgi:hypothetical protein
MDARAEELIVERLRAAFPDDAVLGEERSGATAGRSGPCWTIDPLAVVSQQNLNRSSRETSLLIGGAPPSPR